MGGPAKPGGNRSMDAFDDGTVILNTENGYGLAWRLRRLLQINAALALLTALVCFGPRPMDFDDIKFLAGHNAFFFSLSLLSILSPRGSWTINLHGIAHQPVFGSARELAWESVSRVKWEPRFSWLEGDGVTIILDWSIWPKPIAEATRHRIEKALAQDFNLAPPPSAWWNPRWTILGQIFSKFIWPLIFAIIYYGVVIYLTYYCPNLNNHFLLWCWLVFAILAPMFVQNWILILYQKWQSRRCIFDRESGEWVRIYDDWPWRSRKSRPVAVKAGELAVEL